MYVDCYYVHFQAEAMIDKQFAEEIRHATQIYWDGEVGKPDFIERAKGKEIGHRIADLVDDNTTALLTLHYPYATKHQYDKQHIKVKRSMGDIWLKCNEIYHPINVKTGVSGKGGAPNMVSLKKVLKALLLCQIDSYYLLMVKLALGNPIRCTVYFVDMLDYLDYVSFDSGPGQIMLKADAFFEAMERGLGSAERTMQQKVQTLFTLLEDSVRRLVKNRQQALAEYQQRVARYAELSHHIVTPATQAALNLQ